MKTVNSDLLLIGAIVMVAACYAMAYLRVPAGGTTSGVEREDVAAMAADKAPNGCASSSETVAKEVGKDVLLFVVLVAIFTLKLTFIRRGGRESRYKPQIFWYNALVRKDLPWTKTS